MPQANYNRMNNRSSASTARDAKLNGQKDAFSSSIDTSDDKIPTGKVGAALEKLRDSGVAQWGLVILAKKLVPKMSRGSFFLALGVIGAATYIYRNRSQTSKII